MKITSIQISQFQGARNVDLRLATPVNLIVGANHSGKSSIGDAVRLALMGDAVRVLHKKDFGQMVSDGARTANIEIGIDGTHKATIALPSGKTDTGGYVFSSLLRPCLVAQSFARMKPDDRRSMLFDLVKLSASGAEFKRRLLAKGLNAAKVEQIMPLLRSGADAGNKAAAGYARDEKAAWRTLTGEAWGSDKSEGWKAPKPAFDAAKLAQAQTDLAQVDAAIAEANKEAGALDAAHRTAVANAQRVAQLQSKADHKPRILAKLAVDEKQAAEWVAKVEEARAAAGTKPAQAGAPLTCPCCGVVVRMDAGKLVEYLETALPTHDAETAARLPEYEAALKLSQSAVANDKRDLAEDDSAAAVVAELKKSTDAAPTQEAIDAARATLARLNECSKALAAVLAALQEAQRQGTEADKITDGATTAHENVMQWLAIADQLAPDGIQAEMLAEALTPINARLVQSAADAQWPVVVIDAEMGIMAGGRGYNLLSESEQWRVDAMIAEAVSHLSGVKLLMLDRFDVLDLQGRGDLIAWLDALAANDEIDTALVFGTLKAVPSALPETMAAHWIEGGAIDSAPTYRVAA